MPWTTQDRTEYYKDPDSSNYVVIYPEQQIVLIRVSDTDISKPLEEFHETEELPGYEVFKILAADKLGYDASTLPCIKTVLAEKLHTEKTKRLPLYVYLDSPLPGIPVLVAIREENVFCEPLIGNGFSYREECLLADIDGDGVSEIMTVQYTSLWGHADSLGSAYTILKWDSFTIWITTGMASPS